MAYATVADVQARMARDLSTDEEAVCAALLEDAAVMIDSLTARPILRAAKLVSIRMVQRALGDGGVTGVPMGATQGSMSGLGYSQSWTISGGSTGELYIGKAERQLLGLGNAVGSYSPTQALAPPQGGSGLPGGMCG